jgi:DNA invertase Pin-like site-specific DNA recombinase
MKAAIYCRVSTARQAGEDKVSMDDQEARCRSVCEAKSWEIVHVYDEGDASAGTAQRGEFQRMIADAKVGRFDIIVAREVSRLSRVAQARQAIEDLMANWGIAVCNARTTMVYSEGDGLGASLIWTVEAKMAEAEWAERSFRTKLGMYGKAERGLVPGSKAPFGYAWSGGDGSHLVVEPNSAEIVVRIFDALASGTTCRGVARELNLDQLPSPGRGASGWLASTIHDIGTRGAYIGHHRYGVEQWRRLNSEKERQAWASEYAARVGMAPVRIPAKVKVAGDRVYEVNTPTIVSQHLWDAVAGRLTRARRGSRPARATPMLLGVARCEECGRHMRVTWGRGNGGEYYFYRCDTSTGDTTRPPCRTRNAGRGTKAYVSAVELERLVWSLVDDMLSRPDTLAKAIGLKLAEEVQRAPVVAARLARHESRLAKTERAWDAARRAFFAGDLDEETFERDRRHYERELTMLRDEIGRMKSAAEDRGRQIAHAELAAQIAERWPTIRAALTDDEKRKLVWELVRDVTVTADDCVTVTGALGGALGSTESVDGGRYWTRTSDLVGVNDAL